MVAVIVLKVEVALVVAVAAGQPYSNNRRAECAARRRNETIIRQLETLTARGRGARRECDRLGVKELEDRKESGRKCNEVRGGKGKSVSTKRRGLCRRISVVARSGRYERKDGR